MKKHNPNSNWLSIIIPAYNCRDTIARLLDSILDQHDDDLEIIICDDHSTDNFMDNVVPYIDKLNIKYFQTIPRELHCPGNTRFDGWHHATGEWITFIDNDDMFEPDVFKDIKKGIEDNNEERFLYTPFRDYFVETGNYMQIFDGITWMHGKFYNRQWLIDEGIDFKENLYTHEDLYFNSLVIATMVAKGYGYTKLEKFYTYKWVYRADSMSRRYARATNGFIETYFKDYIYAILEPWLGAYHKCNNLKDYFFRQLSSTILYLYFYYQSFVWSKGADNVKKDNIKIIRYTVNRICKEFNCTRHDILNFLYSDPMYYNRIKHEAEIGNCEFIEVVSLADFINSL